MATRSTITAKFSNGQYGSIYCHWDGYLSNNGKILLENYQDQIKIEQLISLGYLSSLAETIETCDKIEDDDTEPTFSSKWEPEYPQDYNYFWDGSKWFVQFRSDYEWDYELLTEELIKKDI